MALSGLPTGDCVAATGDDAIEVDEDEDDDDDVEPPAAMMKPAVVVACRVGDAGDACMFVRSAGLIEAIGVSSTSDIDGEGHD